MNAIIMPYLGDLPLELQRCPRWDLEVVRPEARRRLAMQSPSAAARRSCGVGCVAVSTCNLPATSKLNSSLDEYPSQNVRVYVCPGAVTAGMSSREEACSSARKI